VSGFGAWSNCSAAVCGAGTQESERSIAAAGRYGGAACPPLVRGRACSAAAACPTVLRAALLFPAPYCHKVRTAVAAAAD
jgi:hypothetical protein